MMDQALKESKVDYDSSQRRMKDDEIAAIAQVPELRQQKVQQILNSNVDKKQLPLLASVDVTKPKMKAPPTALNDSIDATSTKMGYDAAPVPPHAPKAINHPPSRPIA